MPPLASCTRASTKAAASAWKRQLCSHKHHRRRVRESRLSRLLPSTGGAYEHLEPLRWGMRIVLIVLGASCVAFGALPGLVIDHVAVPAAAVLLHPAAYTAGLLDGPTAVARVTVSFSYVGLSHVVVAVVTVVLGIALAVRYVRRGEPAAIRLLRAVHTGSINDYAAFLVAGLLTAVVVLWV